MRILFVSTLYHPHAIGGAEASAKLLAEACRRAGDEAAVATLAPDGVARTAQVEGVRVHYLPLRNLFFPYPWQPRPAWRARAWHLLDAWNPVMAARLMRVVDQEAPDLVHVHNLLGFSSAIWPALARRGVPVVQTLHDHYTACCNSLMYRNGRNCRTRCLGCRVLGTPRRLLSRRVDVVTAVSRRLMDRIAGHGVFAGVGHRFVIPNWNADPPQAPRPVPRPGMPLRLGFLGRIEAIKGPDVLLEAVRGLPPGQVELRLGGGGVADYVRGLQARFAGPGVVFLGPVERTAFLSSIDVLVVPSVVEDSLPRVVHEALGWGVPVIGSAIGGIPEMIRDGETGFLVPPGDAGALRALLGRLVEQPPDWAAMSAAGLRDAQRFGMDVVLAAYREAWRQALAARRGRPAAAGGDARSPIGAAQP